MLPTLMALGALVFTTALWQAWRLRFRGDDRAKVRPLAAMAGIVGITISVIGLLAMLTHAILVVSQTGHSSYYVLAYYSWAALFGVFGLVCSLFNSGLSRLLACGCGLAVTFLWYQVSLGV